MWEGSVERNCEPMNKNRIEGAVEQGERAKNREALVIKARRRKSGGCAVKECVLTWGGLAPCLKGQRSRSASEESAEVVVASDWAGEAETVGEGPNERECSRPCRCRTECVRSPGNRGG